VLAERKVRVGAYGEINSERLRWFGSMKCFPVKQAKLVTDTVINR